MKKIYLYIILTILSFSTFFSQVQTVDSSLIDGKENKVDTTQKNLFLIIKADGTEYLGEIISDDGREILILTKSLGKIFLNKSNLAAIKSTNELKIKENSVIKDFRNDGPFTTRYYFTNNALPVKKGDNYAMINLYGPESHFAVTDKLSLGFMTSWIGSPIALASKLSIYSKYNFHFSIGNIFGNSMYLAGARTLGGLHWATLTFGNRQRNLSISGGYGYINDNGNIFNHDLGSNYSLQGKYAFDVDNYSTYEINTAVRNTLDISRFYDNKFQDALVVGLAGISPVGKKASFIFDAMVVVNQKKDIKYTDYYVNVDYYDYYSGSQVNETFKVGKGELTNNGLFTAIIFMPSMRFNTSYETAFQISLAGIITSTTDRIDFGSEKSSIPLPTVSILRKF